MNIKKIKVNNKEEGMIILQKEIYDVFQQEGLVSAVADRFLGTVTAIHTAKSAVISEVCLRCIQGDHFIYPLPLIKEDINKISSSIKDDQVKGFITVPVNEFKALNGTMQERITCVLNEYLNGGDVAHE